MNGISNAEANFNCFRQAQGKDPVEKIEKQPKKGCVSANSMTILPTWASYSSCPSGRGKQFLRAFWVHLIQLGGA